MIYRVAKSQTPLKQLSMHAHRVKLHKAGVGGGGGICWGTKKNDQFIQS